MYDVCTIYIININITSYQCHSGCASERITVIILVHCTRILTLLYEFAIFAQCAHWLLAHMTCSIKYLFQFLNKIRVHQNCRLRKYNSIWKYRDILGNCVLLKNNQNHSCRISNRKTSHSSVSSIQYTRNECYKTRSRLVLCEHFCGLNSISPQQSLLIVHSTIGLGIGLLSSWAQIVFSSIAINQQSSPVWRGKRYRASASRIGWCDSSKSA